MSAQDIAATVDLERPTVHRILRCLVAEGLAAQDAASRKYHLGHKIYEFGLAAASRFVLRDYCESGLARIAAATGDTVFLTVRSGFESVILERKEGPFAIKTMPLAIGDRRPMGVGAGGLAILMSLPDDQVETILSANSKSLVGLHGVDRKALFGKVRRTRARGYALARGRVGLSISGIGMPVRNRWGIACAAVSVTAISIRMEGEHLRLVIDVMTKEIRNIESSLPRC